MPKVQPQIKSRAPMEHMLRIHQLLHSQEYPNCAMLGREFELSSRTVGRDLDFMKYRLDLPIEYDPQRYGFYYSQKVDRFDRIRFPAKRFLLHPPRRAVPGNGGDGGGGVCPAGVRQRARPIARGALPCDEWGP